MSSVYYALCLSHDPAILIEKHEWRHGFADALEAVKGGLSGHEACDVVVGRYSYPLVEVCCPGRTKRPCAHTDDRWIDAGWLRLLVLSTPEAIRAARVPRCWTPERARRLRVELEMPTEGSAPND